MSVVIHELASPLPVHTPKGTALAIILTYQGFEHDMLWTCIQDETGEIWHWYNPDVRVQKYIGWGRTSVTKDKIRPDPGV